MSVSQEELQALTVDKTSDSFDAFAEDISTMFDTDVSCLKMDETEGTIADLKEDYKKLAAVCSVKAEGVLQGELHFVFNKEGLFTLAGTFVMQPEKVIEQNRKTGSEEEANEIGDAIGEVGNLMTGSWDRVFREEMEGHGHFVQSGTFVGNPWNKPESTIRLEKDEPLVLIQYQITVDPLEPFLCTAIYPQKIFLPPGMREAPSAEPAAEEEPAEAASAEAVAAEPEPAAAEPAQPAEPDQQVEQQTAAQPEPAPQPQQQTPPPPPPPPQAQPQQSTVSDAIKNITQSSASLPGEPIHPAILLTGFTAKDIMRTDIIWAGPDDTVESLVGKMQQNDSGYIMIGTDGNLEGIVSKSDVRGAMSPYLQSMFVKWRGPMDIATLQIKSKWIMSRPVRTVTPEAGLNSVIRAMTEHGGRCMPVVDKEGKVLGQVTVFEVFKALQSAPAQVASTGQPAQSPPL